MTVVLADVEEAALDVAVKELSERGARVRGIPTDELEMKGSAVGVTLLCPGNTRTNIHECRRNWPVRLGVVPDHSPDPLAQATLQGARTLMEQEGIEPSVLADAVVDAVRTRRFLIADNEYVEAALQSLSGLLKGENPTLPILLAGSGSGG